ncbi:MAG TPA: hypothetical protein DD632_04500 [Oribacterium sp.]|nr:hypothetical protein [Oribacterium sp.]
MKKYISKRMLYGIAGLVIILVLMTLGLRIYLRQALTQHELHQVTEAAPSETREQLILSETAAVQEAETGRAPVDPIQQFEADFLELDALEEEILQEQEGSALKEDYTTIARLWNKELDALGQTITKSMSESEKEAYIAEANAFLISRNHECMKELGKDKLSVLENVDYLRREITLTEQRCRDLLKDYRRYLLESS